MDTENVGIVLDGIITTIIENSDRIWRRMDRDDRMAHTNDDIETLSRKIAYRKHIIYLEFELEKF